MDEARDSTIVEQKIVDKIRLMKFYFEKFIELKEEAEGNEIQIFSGCFGSVKINFDDDLLALRIELCKTRGE